MILDDWSFWVHTFFRSMQHVRNSRRFRFPKLNHLSTSSNLHYQQELIKINYHKEIHPYKYKKWVLKSSSNHLTATLKLYHHPWGNEDLAHHPCGAGQSPFTRHPLKPISLSFVLEDCGVLKIYSSATGFSLVCPSFIKLIGHNLRGDSVRSGCTQRLLVTPQKTCRKWGFPVEFHWNHMSKNLLPDPVIPSNNYLWNPWFGADFRIIWLLLIHGKCFDQSSKPRTFCLVKTGLLENGTVDTNFVG